MTIVFDSEDERDEILSCLISHYGCPSTIGQSDNCICGRTCIPCWEEACHAVIRNDENTVSHDDINKFKMFVDKLKLKGTEDQPYSFAIPAWLDAVWEDIYNKLED